MKSNAKIVLYFLPNGDSSPELREKAKALKVEGEELTIRYRNGTVPVNGAPEVCDYVAGDPIPAEYSARFPTLSENGVTEAFAPDTRFSPDDRTPPNAGVAPQAQSSTEKEDALAAEVGSVGGGWGTGA